MTAIASFLESEGGKTFALIFMILSLATIALIMVLTGHPPKEAGVTLLSSAFAALMSALIARLGKVSEGKVALEGSK
jgi:hypothetical protein